MPWHMANLQRSTSHNNGIASLQPNDGARWIRQSDAEGGSLLGRVVQQYSIRIMHGPAHLRKLRKARATEDVVDVRMSQQQMDYLCIGCLHARHHLLYILLRVRARVYDRGFVLGNDYECVRFERIEFERVDRASETEVKLFYRRIKPDGSQQGRPVPIQLFQEEGEWRIKVVTY